MPNSLMSSQRYSKLESQLGAKRTVVSRGKNHKLSTMTKARVFKLSWSPGIDSMGTNSACLCSLAGRYDKPIPTRFLAPIGCLKIPAQLSPWPLLFLYEHHRLNIELDLQSLFGLLCTAVLISWDPATPSLPTQLGSYTRALLVSQDRRPLFVTPLMSTSNVKYRHRYVLVLTFNVRA